MPNLTVPYKAIITFRVHFKNDIGDDIDPNTVTLELAGQSYVFGSSAIVKDSVGHYHFVWVADQPGRWKRVWVGEGPGTYYVESHPATINVQKSVR